MRLCMFFGRSLWLVLLLVVAFATGPVTAQAQEHLRWELVTNGTSNLGSGGSSSSEATVPKLTGSDATFLFRLDAQPLLNYGTPPAPLGTTRANGDARLSMHLVFETGITSVARAVTARAETAVSPVVEALKNQGATVTGTTTPGATLTRQRAFTTGFEFSANRLFMADKAGAFMELGAVAKGHFDAFLDDERFFEKDGLTYVKVTSPLGSEGGYYRGEFGFRFRLSQPEEKVTTIPVSDGMTDKGSNVEDLLLFEFLYQRSDAVRGLVLNAATENRLVLRFLATPELPDSMTTKHVKVLMGLEVNTDREHKGGKDIRMFYGVNVDLKSLF